MMVEAACRVASGGASALRAELWVGWRSVHEHGQARMNNMDWGLSSSLHSRGRCGPRGWVEDGVSEGME